MKTSPDNGSASADSRAFTKVELLVIIVVVGLLAVLRLSAATIARNHDKINQCAGNLRQLGQSLLLYANDNSGKMLAEPTSYWGSWLWDMDWNTSLTINSYGTPADRMYCPGTAPRFSKTDNMRLYNFVPNNLRVIGYALTLPNTISLASSNVNVTVNPFQPVAGGYTNPPTPASQRVLTADATLSTPSSPPNYVNILGGYTLPHLSPHLDGFIPAGGNVVMLDGHVEWRPFSQMRLRNTPTPGNPYFYW